MSNYIVKIDGYDDYHIDYEINDRLGNSFTNLVKDVFYKLKIKTSRSNPEEVPVVIYKTEIKDGKQVERKVRSISVMPSKERMTSDEFCKERDESLADLPTEFQSVISGIAYDRGHSAGYEEVMGHIDELVSAFSGPIANYRARIERASNF